LFSVPSWVGPGADVYPLAPLRDAAFAPYAPSGQFLVAVGFAVREKSLNCFPFLRKYRSAKCFVDRGLLRCGAKKGEKKFQKTV